MRISDWSSDVCSSDLIEEQAPATGSLDDFYTPLTIACREGDASIVRLLLAAGADPKRSIGLMHGTSMHEARYFGPANVLRELVSAVRQAGSPVSYLSDTGPYNGLTALTDQLCTGHVKK